MTAIRPGPDGTARIAAERPEDARLTLSPPRAPDDSQHRLWLVRHEGDVAVVVLHGNWRYGDGLVPDFEARAIRSDIAGAGHVRFDTDGLLDWDSLLVATVWRLRDMAQAASLALDEGGLPPSAQRLLALAGPAIAAPGPGTRRTNPLQAIGTATLGALAAVGAGAELAAGAVAALADTLVPRTLWPSNRRTRMQGGDLLDAVYRAGPSALPIVGVVTLLLGAILAFIGAVQLRKLGAEIFVSQLVGLSLVRELAVVMTAIILAGRTGGANAARLATMQANEEIDALRVLGISEQTYLVLPMTLSLVLTMPLLYLYACVIGMAGGALVATTMLDLSPLAFATALAHAVPLSQFVFGLIKSVAFAALIGLVSCRIGLDAGRSAAAVGQAATKAVVASIVGVIVLDSAFAVGANAFGF
ncbi:MlaE family ABC transporter permease [Lichenicola sp.]|uniref:MlaE family ABC transporter permease n=1 Tax=Lichenicola sp. TaxID=2804529 RepID=UPI003B0055F5